MSEELPRVLITGITGYIGCHILESFLKDGGFRVRGTVRSKTNTKKIDPLKEYFGEETWNKVELVEADITKEDTIIDAAEGCTYIVHVASPVPSTGRNLKEKDIIEPAINGALAAMKGAKKHGVKRVVLTSSIASIFVPEGWTPEMKKFDSTMWANQTKTGFQDPYSKSKTLAEKAAWEYSKENDIELATILPSVVVGPSVLKEKNFSCDLVANFMTGNVPMMPKLSQAFVDVRDVADAHLKAITVPEAAGKRYILAHTVHFYIEVGQWLHAKYGDTYGKVCREEMGNGFFKFMGTCSGQMKLMSQMYGVVWEWDNKDTKEILGIQGRDIKTGIEECAESLIKSGYVELPKKSSTCTIF